MYFLYNKKIENMKTNMVRSKIIERRARKVMQVLRMLKNLLKRRLRKYLMNQMAMEMMMMNEKIFIKI